LTPTELLMHYGMTMAVCGHMLTGQLLTGQIYAHTTK